MRFWALLVAVSATAIAQDSSLPPDDIASDVATISFAPAPDLSSANSVLATAIPSTLLTAFRDSAVASSLASDFSAGNAPSWYSDLPSDVKDFFTSLDTAASETASLTESSTTPAVSSVSSSPSGAVSSVSSSAGSQPSVASTTDATPASTDDSDAASSTSSSTAGAAAPTNAIVASMAGVAGVLALAVGL